MRNFCTVFISRWKLWGACARILWCTRIIPLQKKLAKFHFHNQVKLRSIKILIGSSQNSSHTLFHFLLLILISFLKNAYLVKHTVIVVLPYLLECNHRNLFFKMGFRWGSIWKVVFWAEKWCCNQEKKTQNWTFETTWCGSIQVQEWACIQTDMVGIFYSGNIE